VISEQIKEELPMRKLSPFVLGLSIAVAGSALAAAQDASPDFKVLQVTVEYPKPYKGGMIHDKTESAFVAAMTKAKFPAHYIGLNSMSGKPRAIYLTLYDTFAQWEADNKLVDKNPALAAELERASVADGDLLESINSAVFTSDKELSYKSRPDLTHARYLEATIFRVKSGHRADWYKLAKMVKEAHEKAGTSAHWSMYEIAYGAEDGEYVALSADDSMADIDKGFAENKKFGEALGEDGLKKFRELYSSTVESSRSELYAINPRMSYVSDEWVKGDPDFWKPKPAAAKPAAKPAEAEKK
jgi:hypothetical protein